jgi:hypothetical protein
MLDYCFTSDVEARRQDATSARLFEQLEEDYDKMPHGAYDTFFTDANAGLIMFFLKYLHYVIFGIDPFDEANMKILARMNTVSGQSSIARYIEPFGRFLHWEPSPEIVGALYESSPAFKNFKERNPIHHMMSRQELARVMVSIMRIAALQGAPDLTTTIMGGQLLPSFTGTKTGEFDVTKVWDGLNLDSVDEIRRYILECTRLNSAVTVSHRVATEEFSCDIAGKTCSFPAGTKICIPMCMAHVDEEVWGSTAYEFDMNRDGLVEKHCGFHAVGNQTQVSGALRECPAKELVMNTAVEILQRIGHKRRAQSLSPPSTSPPSLSSPSTSPTSLWPPSTSPPTPTRK